MNKTTVIVLGVIALAILGFFGLEFFRGQELKENLPEYKVVSSYDEAYVMAISKAKAINGQYFISSGVSNSRFLPFEKSIIVLDNTPYEELQKHDFVGFTIGGIKVFHRLIENTDDGWIAQGDNNANPDKTLVTEKNYIGRLSEPLITWETSQK